MLLYSYFEGKRGDAGRVPQIWDWETNDNCPQILRYIQDIGGKNRSHQWSSRGQKLYTDPWGSLQRSRRPLAGGGLHPLPETPLRLGPLGLGSLFALPWKKNSCYCLYYCIFERNKWRWRC